ncbi:unnamed protein product [Nyctereutes procyonoides]|uniref:(raccoon dog) hypothetical protein n=1 Tax=Nyctereutes procyonoides TaxID=34880 RepID=A0A811ZXM4_NYCPR|nr:unnamed protein product [Nyctereutes procyonoides]
MEQWLQRLPIRTLATHGIVLCAVLYDGLTLAACVTSCCRDTREKTPRPKGPPARQALLPGSLGACATRLGMSGTLSRASGARPPRGRASRPVGAAVDGPWEAAPGAGGQAGSCLVSGQVHNARVYTLESPRARGATPGDPGPPVRLPLSQALPAREPRAPVSVKLPWGTRGVGSRSESQRPIPVSSALKSVMTLPRRHLDSLPGARPWGGSLLSRCPKQQGPGRLDLVSIEILVSSCPPEVQCLGWKVCAASWFLSLFFFKPLSQRTVSRRVVAAALCASSSCGPASLGRVVCMDVHPLIVQAFASLQRRRGKGRP